MAKIQTSYATGRRKVATARVYLRPGTGRVTVNTRELDDYFSRPTDRMLLKAPLVLTGTQEAVDIVVSVRGGGSSGQAGAVRHGIARALCRFNPELRGALKKGGYLTRDSRMVERKKYGQKGARARFQFSKR
jgi:small subunit ribosomal protein S9